MRKIFIIQLLLIAVSTVIAQTNFKVTQADKHRIVTGSCEFQKEDRAIFLNALMWSIERGEQFKELITECDYNKLRFTMNYNIIREGQSSFAAKLIIQVGQGRMVYTINDIKGQAAGITAMLGATSFDKMNPDKKPKQKAMIEEFEVVNKEVLNSLFDYVTKHNTNTDFWSSIAEGRLEKGMQSDDVLLTLGKPIDIQKSGDTTQYMYNTFTYVFLENGKVKSFMQ